MAALLASWTCAGCIREAQIGSQLAVRLWKRGQPPIELASGDFVAAGDELYMTVQSHGPTRIYVLSEDASRARLIVYPCRGWDPPANRRRQRIPPPLLGRDTFWPVRKPTAHEHLLLFACARPIAALEGAVLAATAAPPCSAVLDDAAVRWLDGLTFVMDRASSGSPRGRHRTSWRSESSGQEGWIFGFDLAGPVDHG